MASPWPDATASFGFEGTFRLKAPQSPNSQIFPPTLPLSPPNFKSAKLKPTDTEEEKSGSEVETYNTNTPQFSQPSRVHFRSQSISDQLNKTPRVTPNWGHSLSKSYGGSDWPLPASDNSTAVSTPASTLAPNIHTPMFSTPASNDPLWSEQQSNGPKKRGPKPKNEPAATVKLSP